MAQRASRHPSSSDGGSIALCAARVCTYSIVVPFILTYVFCLGIVIPYYRPTIRQSDSVPWYRGT